MKCPHCHVEIHIDFSSQVITTQSRDGIIGKHNGNFTFWTVASMACPACFEAIIKIKRKFMGLNDGDDMEYTIYPRKASRPNAPNVVPPQIAEDFNESCLVISDSPKASAALSRRCLQGVLKDKGYAQHDLVKAIQAAIDSNQLPSFIAENLDAVRNIGNFAAHPLKDTGVGVIEAVEPHEAEWNLDVLEELFDFFYVQPERSKQRRAQLNAKLATLSKPPLK